jgi:hypothetical protein
MSAGCSRPPASRSAVKAFRARRQFAPRTVNGSAMMTQASMTTSESPKLCSDIPATRKPVRAARLPATRARSLVAAAGSRRNRRTASVKNAAQSHSHASRPATPSSTRIWSAELCRCPVRFIKASACAVESSSAAAT